MGFQGFFSCRCGGQNSIEICNCRIVPAMYMGLQVVLAGASDGSFAQVREESCSTILVLGPAILSLI